MFIKKNKDNSKLIDEVFIISSKANKAKKDNKNIINASLGTLYDDKENLITLDTVYNSFRNLNNIDYAKYSTSFNGNENFKKAIKEFVLENKLKNLKTEVITSIGGTGAIYLTINNILDQNDEIIIPDIGWTNYATIAKENNLKITYYKMFDDNNNFNLNDLKEKILSSLKKQNKALIIINSPANNPTGYTLKENEIKELVRFINEVCNNKEVIILNDIAYIDYAYNQENIKNYLSVLDTLNSNALLAITYSCSKAFTGYGMRLGALILAHKDENTLNEIVNAINKSCRSIWSNPNNGAMENITYILKNLKQEYLKEKDKYITLLKERANIFIKEANEVNLNLYPYNEGFFITLKINNNIIDKYHTLLIDNDIYTIKTNNGIRIAICSIPTNKCYGLAKTLKALLNKTKD